MVAAVLIGAVVVLWSFYLFRFSESPNTSEEQFNRTLAEKISDVKSPVYRAGLNVMANGRLFPRAYTWGMADTIRAGAEGRVASVLAFGNLYYGKAPFYYFPGIFAVKLPLGLLLLTAIGAVFLIMRRIPREFVAPLIGLFVLSLLFWIFFAKGSSYGGIRHALSVVPLLALLASLHGLQSSRIQIISFARRDCCRLFAALISAIPVMRPWEYYNEIVGTANGHRYFNDEGVDLGLRSKELVNYYNENLKPTGELPYVAYFGSYTELKKRGLDYLGKDRERDREKLNAEFITGTVILGAGEFTPKLWWDKKTFRETVPTERFGNLFVFRGTFKTSELRVSGLYWGAIDRIYTDKPETEEAIRRLSKSVEIDPRAFFAALELGNQYLKIGNREESLRAYRIAKENVPPSDETGELLKRQIERVETEPLEQIPPVRNPGIE
jgi:tetratricopeptide (TPR) repeat protein